MRELQCLVPACVAWALCSIGASTMCVIPQYSFRLPLLALHSGLDRQRVQERMIKLTVVAPMLHRRREFLQFPQSNLAICSGYITCCCNLRTTAARLHTVADAVPLLLRWQVPRESIILSLCLHRGLNRLVVSIALGRWQGRKWRRSCRGHWCR